MCRIPFGLDERACELSYFLHGDILKLGEGSNGFVVLALQRLHLFLNAHLFLVILVTIVLSLSPARGWQRTRIIFAKISRSKSNFSLICTAIKCPIRRAYLFHFCLVDLQHLVLILDRVQQNLSLSFGLVISPMRDE